jgi:hypothetical protein
LLPIWEIHNFSICLACSNAPDIRQRFTRVGKRHGGELYAQETHIGNEAFN